MDVQTGSVQISRVFPYTPVPAVSPFRSLVRMQGHGVPRLYYCPKVVTSPGDYPYSSTLFTKQTGKACMK